VSKGHIIIDAWMQHPTAKHVNQPCFDSLRRWTSQEKLTEGILVGFTIAAMDEAGVQVDLVCAWWGRHGPTTSSGEVAAIARMRQ